MSHFDFEVVAKTDPYNQTFGGSDDEQRNDQLELEKRCHHLERFAAPCRVEVQPIVHPVDLRSATPNFFTHVAAANDMCVLATKDSRLHFFDESDAVPVFSVPVPEAVAQLFLDPLGRHVVATHPSGSSSYYHLKAGCKTATKHAMSFTVDTAQRPSSHGSGAAQTLGRVADLMTLGLIGGEDKKSATAANTTINCIGWDQENTFESTTGTVLLGTRAGTILATRFDANGMAPPKTVFRFPTAGGVPVSLNGATVGSPPGSAPQVSALAFTRGVRNQCTVLACLGNRLYCFTGRSGAFEPVFEPYAHFEVLTNFISVGVLRTQKKPETRTSSATGIGAVPGSTAVALFQLPCAAAGASAPATKGSSTAPELNKGGASTVTPCDPVLAFCWHHGGYLVQGVVNPDVATDLRKSEAAASGDSDSEADSDSDQDDDPALLFASGGSALPSGKPGRGAQRRTDGSRLRRSKNSSFGGGSETGSRGKAGLADNGGLFGTDSAQGNNSFGSAPTALKVSNEVFLPPLLQPLGAGRLRPAATADAVPLRIGSSASAAVDSRDGGLRAASTSNVASGGAVSPKVLSVTFGATFVAVATEEVVVAFASHPALVWSGATSSKSTALTARDVENRTLWNFMLTVAAPAAAGSGVALSPGQRIPSSAAPVVLRKPKYRRDGAVGVTFDAKRERIVIYTHAELMEGRVRGNASRHIGSRPVVQLLTDAAVATIAGAASPLQQAGGAANAGLFGSAAPGEFSVTRGALASASTGATPTSPVSSATPRPPTAVVSPAVLLGLARHLAEKNPALNAVVLNAAVALHTANRDHVAAAIAMAECADVGIATAIFHLSSLHSTLPLQEYVCRKALGLMHSKKSLNAYLIELHCLVSLLVSLRVDQCNREDSAQSRLGSSAVFNGGGGGGGGGKSAASAMARDTGTAHFRTFFDYVATAGGGNSNGAGTTTGLGSAGGIAPSSPGGSLPTVTSIPSSDNSSFGGRQSSPPRKQNSGGGGNATIPADPLSGTVAGGLTSWGHATTRLGFTVALDAAMDGGGGGVGAGATGVGGALLAGGAVAAQKALEETLDVFSAYVKWDAVGLGTLEAGNVEQVVYVCRKLRRLGDVLESLVLHGQHRSALGLLIKSCSDSAVFLPLWKRHATELMRACPVMLVKKAWIPLGRQFGMVALDVLPALARYKVSCNEAEVFADADGNESRQAPSTEHVGITFLQHAINVVGDPDAAVHNLLLQFLAQSGSDEDLIAFVRASQSCNRHFALRQCAQRQRWRACAELYFLTGDVPAAVETALHGVGTKGGLDLAKEFAKRISDDLPGLSSSGDDARAAARHLRVVTWRRIVAFVAKREGGSRNALLLLAESGDAVNVSDVLPHLSDDVMIVEFKNELLSNVTSFERMMVEVSASIATAHRNASVLRADATGQRSAHARITANKKCGGCGQTALNREIIVFRACGHVFHRNCYAHARSQFGSTGGSDDSANNAGGSSDECPLCSTKHLAEFLRAPLTSEGAIRLPKGVR